MPLVLTLLLLGLVLLFFGGNIFVDSAAWLAEKTGIPKIIVGATVVSLATTAPEMLVSFVAAAGGNIDIAIGNAVGSATVNTGFIMAFTIVFLPVVLNRADILVKTLVMLAAALILLIFGTTGQIGLLPCILLLLGFAVFLGDNIIAALKSLKNSSPPAVKAVSPNPKKDIAVNAVKFIAGAAFIVIGSQLLVDNGSQLAAALGVSDRVIAVSVISIGTSLPELVTAITAVIKRQSELSVGNIIGANIVNLAFVQPMCAILSRQALPVSPNLARVDIPVCLAVGTLAFVPMLWRQKSSRTQGILLMLTYTAYLTCTVML